MARQSPTIFLSHSGQQKGFAWSLYRELVHVNHSVFFDQDSTMDSLPKGSPFPSRIVEACCECKLGIVVLSSEYIESIWPMLELQQLIFNNRNKPNNVYPIFYALKPADLSRAENLERWQSIWREKEPSWQGRVQTWFREAPSTSTSDPQPTLDIKSWPEALEKLRLQNGDILPNNKDEHRFVQTIVSNICKRFPPPQSLLMDNCWKGADHISQEIHKVFQEEEKRRKETDVDHRGIPVVVGMHGVGGSGKSTVCKFMVDFYGKDYPGRCFCLEFPSKEEVESKSLVQSIKDILSRRGILEKEILDSITSVDEALSYIQDLLRRYKVFLILDNVWDWALQVVRQIVRMEFGPDSRLLVTARSAPLLRRLSMGEAMMSAMRIMHVPSMCEEEAIEALMAYSMASLHFSASRVDLLEGLARSCFHGGQCHPLLLKGVGVKLRHVSGFERSAQDWAQLIRRLQASIRGGGDEDIEDTVVSVLKTSYEQLRSNQLKDTFLKLGTCIPQFEPAWSNKYRQLCKWLAMISGRGFPTVEDIRDQLIELEYHGLIEVQKDQVRLHDLQMLLIDKLSRENDGVSKRWLLFVDYFRSISTAASETSDDEWRRIKYIYAVESGFDICACWRISWLRRGFIFDRRPCVSPIRWQCIEVLHLENSWVCKKPVRVSVEHMGSLRHLVLESQRSHKLTEIGGWHGAPNLTSVKLTGCRLLMIESMTCLSRLESLVVSGWDNGVILKGTTDLAEFLGHKPKLRELRISKFKSNWPVGLEGQLSANFPSLQQCQLAIPGIRKFASVNLIQLRVLDLSDCVRLQRMELGSMRSVTALEELRLARCRKLKRIPDLELLVCLRVLVLWNCSALEEVKVGYAAPLRDLCLEGCHALREVKVGDAVPLTDVDLEGCHALREVKVGDAAVTSLASLSLQYGTCCHLSGSISSPSISAFTNLRKLSVIGGGKDEPDFVRVDLPVRLEELRLQSFETGNEITGLNRFPNLRSLSVLSCASLTSITGLGALTNLEVLHIEWCQSLREVGHWEPPFDRYKLDRGRIRIWNCPRLSYFVFPCRVSWPQRHDVFLEGCGR